MIVDNRRMIFVLGMARSGTTAFTYVLAQHPEIFLFSNTYNLENTLILNRKVGDMQKIVNEHPNKRILMKRPWAERNPNFFKEQTPQARFIFLVRDFEAICKSWSNTNWVAPFLKDASIERKRKYYDKHIQHMHTFSQALGTERVWQAKYERFAAKPLAVLRRITAWLNLERFGYNASMIRLGGDWSFMTHKSYHALRYKQKGRKRRK